MLPVQLLLVIAATTTSGLVDAFHRRHNHHRQLLKAWQTLSDRSPEPFRGSCPGCAHTTSEVTALRIEMIKQQILRKLRLKEPPSVSIPLSSLPKPLANGTIIHTSSIVESNRDVDDFYGTTDQVIIFPQEDGIKCFPGFCFTFRLPAELQAEDVTMAEMWLYKEQEEVDSDNRTLTLSEGDHWVSNHSIQKLKQLAVHQTQVKAGWIKFDLVWAVKNWLEYQELIHDIHVRCDMCENTPVSLESEHKPFIIINTKTVKKNRRIKRNINCHPGVSECCRENLYISFADIGWDDWILQPSGYHAYFCHGSCTTAASIAHSGTHYNSLIQRMIYLHSARARELDLVPCCTPTHLSSLQLLYMDNNQTITHKTLPNMVVESCGCM